MKKITLTVLMGLMLSGFSLAQRPVKLQNETDSVSYALGFLGAYRILENYPGIEKNIILETYQYAFDATLKGEMPFVDEYKTRRFVDEYYENVKRQIWGANREASERFLTANAAKRGVVETSSGLQYEVVRAGNDNNERPRAYDDMVISYVGKTIDGVVFDEDDRDSTYPASLNDGLEEGTQLMSPGAKYIFYIPHRLAFGDDSHRGVPPYSTVIYEVEMISMTRDHNYYDEEEDAVVNMDTWGNNDSDGEDDSDRAVALPREAGDYIASALPHVGRNVSVEGYDRDEIVKSYLIEGFQVVMTGDKTIVLDSRGQEVFRNTLDEERNSYDSYYLTEYRHKNGQGPLFLILDMGFDHGSYYGSMVYKIENGRFSQVPEFLNLVTFNRDDDDEHYGRLTPVLDLYRSGNQTIFCFETPILSYNPAGKEVLVPGEDFQYIYDGEKLVESGAATELGYFRTLALTKQFQAVHDYRIWHAEKGDIDGDGREELVVFVYENETIYVCELNGDRLGSITEHDLPYDYSINRSSRVLRGNVITVERDDNDQLKRLVIHNGNLVEKE